MSYSPTFRNRPFVHLPHLGFLYVPTNVIPHATDLIALVARHVLQRQAVAVAGDVALVLHHAICLMPVEEVHFDPAAFRYYFSGALLPDEVLALAVELELVHAYGRNEETYYELHDRCHRFERIGGLTTHLRHLPAPSENGQ